MAGPRGRSRAAVVARTANSTANPRATGASSSVAGTKLSSATILAVPAPTPSRIHKCADCLGGDTSVQLVPGAEPVVTDNVSKQVPCQKAAALLEQVIKRTCASGCDLQWRRRLLQFAPCDQPPGTCSRGRTVEGCLQQRDWIRLHGNVKRRRHVFGCQVSMTECQHCKGSGRGWRGSSRSCEVTKRGGYMGSKGRDEGSYW